MADTKRLSNNQSWRQRDQRPAGRASASLNWRTPDPRPPSQSSHNEPLDQSAGNNPASPGTSTALEEGRRVYVGNMPYIAKEQNVRSFFEAEGYIIAKLDISIDPFTGRNPSYCFVEFDTKDEADRAIKELSGRDFMRRPLIKIKPCTPKKPDNRRKGPGFVFDRWGRNDAPQHFKGYSGRGRRLKVMGLPKPSNQAFMNQRLAEFFQDFAVEAISKTICPHYEGKKARDNPHYAYVDFASASDAQAAKEALDGRVGPWETVLTLEHATRDWREQGM
ncbi:hypothetical protein BDV06DRAFT_223960 [Aspergillus oleicola]